MTRKTRIVTLAFGALTTAAVGQSNIDPVDKFAWTENAGWLNFRPEQPTPDDGVVVGLSFLGGFAWGENVGWINLGDGDPGAPGGEEPSYANTDAADFGVNVDEDGLLFGYAWGENIGWINFDLPQLGLSRAHYDYCTRELTGFAWAENIGWVHVGDESFGPVVGPCLYGDTDCDGEVAAADVALFVASLAGPDVPVNCPTSDGDADGDADLFDVALFQNAFGE